MYSSRIGSSFRTLPLVLRMANSSVFSTASVLNLIFLQEFSSNIFVRTVYLKMQLFIVYFLFRLLNYRYRAKRGEFVQFLTQSRKLNM